MPTIVAYQTRGPLVENIYRGDAAVVDAAGRLLFWVGDPEKVTFWRSAAKPFQALPLITSGAAASFGFSDQHLAVFAASHNGEPVHVETVLDALQRAGLSPALLQCGVHAPFDRATAEELRQSGREPEPLHNNCSGKHTGMLALARHWGLPLEDYLEPESELQQRIRATVAAVADLPEERIAIGVDGCGVPVFGLPLVHMALAFARLADPTAMPDGLRQAGQAMRDAMIRHPYLVAGRRRICTDLMSLPGSRFIAKSGAEGVYCVGILPEAVQVTSRLYKAGALGGVGIALKVEDGNDHVRHLMVVEIMRQLGLVTEEELSGPLARYRSIPVKNLAGRPVGELKPVFQLEGPSDGER